ncbi:metal-binding protein [Calothrix sp. UHCC 0171]|uniref:metal-binding protein n=1 Tax=Calothrix sp. UHCC 0171 TaxID=3110245 RepID=UPI002B1F58C6|nr:metal-binding protein [Calothrix sp. UHCC 0171]MEA5572604.1 metal-binding protein [Calothrix sp. UHCC 0171]
MPSGRTHDRITIWTLPIVVAITFWQTRSGNLTLLVATGFMLGGLMFGPDLDIYSRQFQRWGWLRWIWLPYQKSLRHRSVFSHGPLIGTTIRVIYITILLSVITTLGLLIVEKVGNMPLNWQGLGDGILGAIAKYKTEFFALFLGLEVGAMSHSLSDWTGSAYKRFKKQGIAGILPKSSRGKGKGKRRIGKRKR